MKLRSIEEILTKFREVVRRHRRRYLERNLRPCPYNCKAAEVGTGHKVLGCEGCGSTNPDRCYDASKFVPILSKEECVEQFRQDLRNPQILLRDYRDVVFFMWVLGAPADTKVDETVLQKAEANEPKQPKPTISATINRHRIIRSNRPAALYPEQAGSSPDPAKTPDKTGTRGQPPNANTKAGAK
jgi:hypothetical protein